MMIVQHKVGVLSKFSRVAHTAQQPEEGRSSKVRAHVIVTAQSTCSATTLGQRHVHTHTHTHAHTHTLRGRKHGDEVRSAHPSREACPWRPGARLTALRPAAVRSRRRALPHEGLGCGALAWLVDGLLLLLVEATAAAMAAAEERAGASRLRLKAPEGPGGGGAAAGFGSTMSAAAEKAAALRNLLSDAAVVESVRGEPADTGASPAAGDMMVGTLYTVDRGNEPPPRLPNVLAYHELVLWYGDR